MSLSLSNSLSFAQIPLVKIGKNSKKTILIFLEVQFRHEGGPIQRSYFELFFSVQPLFSSFKKSARNEAPFNLF